MEILVVDNASSDETRSIVETYTDQDSRIRYLRQPVTVLPLANFSTALREATHPFFAWAADDDRWHPDFAEVLMTNITAKNLGGAFCWGYDLHWLDSGPRVVPSVTRFPRLSGSYSRARNSLSWTLAPYHSCIYGIFRKEILLAIDALALPDRFIGVEPVDAYIIQQVLFNHPYEVVERPLYYRGIHTARAVAPANPDRDIYAVVKKCSRSVIQSGALSVSERVAILGGLWLVQITDDARDRSWPWIRPVLAGLSRLLLFLIRRAMRMGGWISPPPPVPELPPRGVY